MDEHVRMVGIVAAAVFTAFVVSVYVTQGIPDLPGVFCQVDREAFESGQNLFHQNEFVAARLEFTRSDGGQCDAKAQFYAAYSYYREGCGRFLTDAVLLEQGLKTAVRAIAEASDGDFPLDDPGLNLETAEALKEEIEAKLRSILPRQCR